MTIRSRILPRAMLAATLVLAAPLITAIPAHADEAVDIVDTMSRENTTGWGIGDDGASYSVTPVAAGSVKSGAATLEPLGPGRSARSLLDGVAEVDITAQAEVTLGAQSQGAPRSYASVLTRATSKSGYSARLVISPSGKSTLELGRTDGLSVRTLASTALSFAIPVGERVSVKIEATGQDPSVALSAKAWPAGSAEPDSWSVTYSDSSSARVTAPGTAGALVYAASGGAAVPVHFDELAVRAGADETAAPEVPTEPAEEVPSTDDTEVSTPGPEEPDVPSSTDAPTHPGARGTTGAAAPGTLSYPVPVGAIFVSTNGVDSNPGTQSKPVATVARALQLAPNYGTIVLREGSYHESVFVIPRTGITIQPYPNEEVWFDGAEQVTGWQQQGAVWVKSDWTTFFDSSPTYARGKADGTQPGWQWLDPGKPMAAHPDQIWVDGAALTQVAARNAVTAGTFFVDEAAKQLVVGSDPNGHRVDVSTLSKALTIRATDSVIRGIGVRRYATSVPDMGTVTADQPRITLTDVTIVDNATTGFYTWASDVTLNRVTVARNGLLGAGASQADGLSITGMSSYGNNAQGFNRAPVSGALKITRSRNVEVTDSSFVDNAGQGPWFDESVYNITFSDNDVWGSGGYGLVIELSEKATVANNLFGNNGKAGVLVADSGNVSIWNNTIVGNATAPISITQDDRRASNTALPGHDPRQSNPDPTVPWVVTNIQVVNNVISASAGECLICVRDWSREFAGTSMVTRAEGNVYHRPSASSTAATVLWSLGAGGTATYKTVAEYVKTTGRDVASTAVDGGAVLDADMRLLAAVSSQITGQAVPVPASLAQVSALKAGISAAGVQPR